MGDAVFRIWNKLPLLSLSTTLKLFSPLKIRDAAMEFVAGFSNLTLGLILLIGLLTAWFVGGL